MDIRTQKTIGVVLEAKSRWEEKVQTNILLSGLPQRFSLCENPTTILIKEEIKSKVHIINLHIISYE